jgi:putative membrane-bound dehydrogenase-like protein
MFSRTLFLLTSALLLCARATGGELELREDAAAHTLTVVRPGGGTTLVTLRARPDARPSVHPAAAPDGRGRLTGPDGVFWAFPSLNGRDYVKNSDGSHWRRVSSGILLARGEEVRWATSYDLLDAQGGRVLTETKTWTVRENGRRLLLDVEWNGEAHVDVTVAEGDRGGLTLAVAGEGTAAVNAARQRDVRAQRQRAMWLDLSARVAERDETAHVAVLDHPRNPGYPAAWRVDPAGGSGPVRALQGAWRIERGKRATFRHQLVVYAGALDDVGVDEAWKAFTGERLDFALWVLAREEGRRGATLTGEEVVARMTVADGLEVKLAAAEPMISQAMAFCWDHRGRLWIAENHDYENRKAGFSGAKGKSRIVILEDADGDGRFDQRKVFLEGIPFPAAIAVGFDGLWLGAPPNLLFVPDRDRDDRADANIEVRLTGWGIQDRHETLNSLIWGPDGWLYGCQGYATRSNVGKPVDGGRIPQPGDPFPENIPVKDGQYLDGGVWRYHPTKDRFEILAHGFSNPWGLDFDDVGEMFITACVIPHLWHVIPGGIYHRQGGKHISPYVYDDIKTIADHRHRSAHGGARVYLADEFPASYRGRIFMANLHERALLTDILEPAGSGYIGRHGDDTVLANDPRWIGFSVETGPDGAVYVLDWHDGDICGNDVLNQDTARIFRVAPKGLPGRAGLDLAAKSDLELADLQTHRNDWYVRRARLLLQERAAAGRLDPRTAPRLREILARETDPGRQLRALWALHVTGGLAPAELLALLDHPAAPVRGWAVQLLNEDRTATPAAVTKFAAMARTEPSATVRLKLASALQRLAPGDRWEIAGALAARAEDAEDHNLPKMIWFAVEPLAAAEPARALALAANARLPLVTRFIARRATAAQAFDAVIAAIAAAPDAGLRRTLLEGFRDGLGAFGRRELAAPAGWAALAARLASGGDAAIATLVRHISQLFGDPAATAAQLGLLRDPAAPIERRREALLGLARDAHRPALDAILAALGEPALRRDAIRALAEFEDERVSQRLLAGYAQWNAAEKAEAILALAIRPESARRLLRDLRANRIPKADVSAFAARQLQRVIGPNFTEFWGPLETAAADKEAETARLKRLLTDEALAAARPGRGRGVFERTCAPCHKLYDQGGLIGPDLTGSNRANLDYILGEIINPSEVIQEGYHLVTLTLRDGRTLAGNIAAENERQVVLRTVGQETPVAKADILAREVSPVSMMPEGLLKTLSGEEVRDLIAYLRTTRQVTGEQ